MKDIPIVMFHSVNSCSCPHPMKPLMNTLIEFEEYLKTFVRGGYQILSMDDLVEGRYDEKRPFAVFTFDDGFRDNLTDAMPLMKKYGAHGTIFVNPAYYTENTEERTPYGFMTKDEWKTAADSGVFDVQAHTMTHEFVFSSDKVIDVYTRDKSKKYYWLSWMLFPEAVHAWDSRAGEFVERIPEGFPIFEYTRRLSAPAFRPNAESVRAAVSAYQNGERNLEKLGEIARAGGSFENEKEFSEVIRSQLLDCKRNLEEACGKRVHTLCFPGGGYTDEVLRVASEAGYLCYMRASRLKDGNNFEHLQNMRKGEFVGYNRMSFSKVRKSFLPKRLTARVTSAVKLGAYQQKPFYVFVRKILRKLG